MTPSGATRGSAWSDVRLVRECRKGNQSAWAPLVGKYKNLIYSVAIKFGLSREESADIFQSVCVELLGSLHDLREPKALPKWLMQTTYHQCLRWKKDRMSLFEDVALLEDTMQSADILPEGMLYELQREQGVRNAISALPERCNRLVNMLFFSDPPRPYDEVAKELKLATGSIGFIRGRCLQKLRKALEEQGFQ